MKKLNSVSVKVGEPLTLIAKVDGFPTPSYQWYFNGDALKESELRTFEVKEKTFSINIAETTQSDDGLYKLVSENTAGTASTEAEIRVLGKEEWKFLENKMHFAD